MKNPSLIVVTFSAILLAAGCQKYDDSDIRKEIRELSNRVIGFDSYDTKTIARGDTLWTVMDQSFTKADFAAFTAGFMTEDGTPTAIATKSAAGDNPWKIVAVAPEFDGDGKLVRPAGVVVTKAPQAGSRGVLKVALINNNGKEATASLVVDITPNYLAFCAEEAGATVSMEIIGETEAPSLEYSTDLNEWTAFDFSDPTTITLKKAGDKVYWRNSDKTDHFSKDAGNYMHFILGDRKVAASGNIMSLIDRRCESLTIPSDYCFRALFRGCVNLTEAPELPAMDLADDCYSYLFYGCTSLEEAPELPAEKLSLQCYRSMFYENSSLKKAPALPAKQLADSCYRNMFHGCVSLTEAPELPATEMKDWCYSYIFAGCSSIETAPALPATNLAGECYMGMFYGCSSLKAAPTLPATTLAGSCYCGMFFGCSALKTAPKLPATKAVDDCYLEMFKNCSSLETAPELPAKELAYECYAYMFNGCSSLKEAPELPAMEIPEACYYTMFENCTSLVKAPKLPATKLGFDCYTGMFYNCTALETAPELPATELDANCYFMMFSNCTSLKTAPELPATELADWCYYGMFNNCPNLNYIKVGFTDWGDGSATGIWLTGVASEGTFECPEGLEIKYGSNYIPEGWSVVSGGNTIAQINNAYKSGRRMSLHPTASQAFSKCAARSRH